MYRFLDRETFESRFRVLFASIFCGVEARRRSFKKSPWTFVLSANRFLRNEREFAEVSKAIESIGDKELVVTSLQLQPLHQWNFIIDNDYKPYLAAMNSEQAGILLGIRRAMFGPSGEWGAIINEGPEHYLEYTIVGGESYFVERWAKLWGGIARMQDEFTAYIDKPAPAGWSAMPNDIKASLLADVKWEARKGE